MRRSGENIYSNATCVANYVEDRVQAPAHDSQNRVLPKQPVHIRGGEKPFNPYETTASTFGVQGETSQHPMVKFLGVWTGEQKKVQMVQAGTVRTSVRLVNGMDAAGNTGAGPWRINDAK